MLPKEFWHEKETDERVLIKCPRCGTFKPLKDGIRHTKNGDPQRYYSTGCGYRFSNKWLCEISTRRDIAFSAQQSGPFFMVREVGL